jgi:hypothetical protein
MGFLDTLRRVLGADPADTRAESVPPLVVEPGGSIEESGADAGPAVPPAPAGLYDRSQWHKKLKRILDELPASRPEWEGLAYEARALKLDPDWVMQCQCEEFLLLVRRVVSDRVVSESEHRKLDLARELVGLTEAEAEAVVHAVVAEAESFFGKPVRDV